VLSDSITLRFGLKRWFKRFGSNKPVVCFFELNLPVIWTCYLLVMCMCDRWSPYQTYLYDVWYCASFSCDWFDSFVNLIFQFEFICACWLANLLYHSYIFFIFTRQMCWLLGNRQSSGIFWKRLSSLKRRLSAKSSKREPIAAYALRFLEPWIMGELNNSLTGPVHLPCQDYNMKKKFGFINHLSYKLLATGEK
jgi:hypothetical protein